MSEPDQQNSRCILVVEDNATLRGLIIRVLNQSGYRAEGVETGSAALERVAADQNLALLLDQKLPDMTGREVIENLREQKIKVPFIVMTGYGDEGLAVEMMKLGADDYLVKGVEIIDLLPGSFERLFRRLETEDKLLVAEQSLRDSEEKYRSMVENLNEVIYRLDDNARITYISPNVQSLAGYHPDELFDKPYVNFIHPDDLEDRALQFMRIISGANEPTEYRFIAKDGRVIWVRTAARRIMKNGRVVGLQGVLSDITARKEAEEKIRYMSFHDRLTGLYNRYYLEEEMNRLNVERQLPLSLIMADLNGLKLINDTYGHIMGDRVLNAAANILKQSARKEEVIARWGGDEFVIFLPHTSQKDVSEIVKRIYSKCSKTSVGDIPVSIALGYATRYKADQEPVDLLKEAEDHMYKNKLTESRSTKSAVLKALLKTLAEKSYETEEHTRNMQDLALKIGVKLGLPESELKRLGLLITLHDIGKINIPEEILTKRGALTNEEWEIIKKHPETGYRIALATEQFAHVAGDILAHHERWEGTGYPHGLEGADIPLLARITAIADACEVMTNGRPYKAAMSPAEVIGELKRCSGSHFDPDLVGLALSVLATASNT